MANWYVSSTAYAAIPVWAASTAYTVGQIIKPLTAPTLPNMYTYRCTTAGTSGTTEPNWATGYGDNGLVTSGGATFTNVSGQGTYGWGAAAGSIYSLTYYGSGGARNTAGDRIFVSSDHVESNAPNPYLITGGVAYGTVQIISVNRAGSVPPVLADYLAGAAITVNSSNLEIDTFCHNYWQGVVFTLGGSANNFVFGGGSTGKSLYFKNCSFIFTTSTAGAHMGVVSTSIRTVFDNTTVTFNNVAQCFFNSSGYAWEFVWINTPTAILGTVPTILFSAANTVNGFSTTLRGVDLSAVNTTLYYGNNQYAWSKFLLDSCRIASGLIRLGTGGYQVTNDEIELVNCYDGTHFLAERHTPAGDVTTEFATMMVGGAQDDVGLFSHKLVSSSRVDQQVMPLESFWLDVENQAIGSSHTATVELVASLALNNTDISLMLEYQGTTGSSLATFGFSLASPLTASAALPLSTATWNSPPTTPVYQRLQVTFTPLVLGRVRGLVRLGRPSTTVFINPVVMIS